MPRRLSFSQLSVSHQPLLYATAALMAGIISVSHLSLAFRHWLMMTASLLLMAIAGWIRKADARLMTALLMMGCAACGGLLFSGDSLRDSRHNFHQLMERGELTPTEPIELWGMLQAAPEPAVDRIYLSLAVSRIASLRREYQIKSNINLIVRFADDEARREYDALQLDYGTRVRVLAYLLNSQGYRNPGAIDFDELLEQHGYAAAAVIKSPLLIERLPDIPLNLSQRFYRWLYGVRARAVSAILHGVREPASGILLAALFGNRHFLSRNTAEAFRAGGTFHLLVISGAHVALISLAVLWLTGWIKISVGLRYAVVIALMWAYALMVGAQPAVTRAVVMLTFALMGQLLYRESSGPNTLAASALALLIWNPQDLFNAGFQLSFLTVLVIVTIAAPLFTRLRAIGQWQPSALTPYPPRVPAQLKKFAELLFWNEAEFRHEMKESLIRFRLEKSVFANYLSLSRAGRVLQWLLRTVFATLLTTIAIQIALLPLMVIHFHRFSFSSPLANVIESAAIFVLMIVGLIYAGVYFVSATLALKLAGIVNWCGAVAVTAADPLAHWHSGSLRMPDYSPVIAALLYSSFFLSVLMLLVALNQWSPLNRRLIGSSRRPFYASGIFISVTTIALLVLFTLIVWHPFRHRYEAGRLSVTFLDVGQGDAIFISFPQGATMLLDSGGRNALNGVIESDESEDVFIEDRIGIGEAAIAPFLWQRGIKRLDYIVASHSDSDHTQGFSEIVRAFDIGSAVIGMKPTKDEQFDVLQRAFDKHHIKTLIQMRGQRFDVDGAHLEFLAPFAEQTNAPRYGNNQSLVVRLTFGKCTFLFTGDVESATERRLLTTENNLQADVLKVAHHGSRTSTTDEFLRRVAARFAVISVASPSPFGHPHPEVVERLQASGAETLRTSDCGAITFSTDGEDLRTETYVRCR
jgi:competence protein ComEC